MSPGEKLDHTPIFFGRHKGKTPNDIAESDPSYIVWMSEQQGLKDKISPLLLKACKQELAEARNSHRVAKDQDESDREW